MVMVLNICSTVGRKFHTVANATACCGCDTPRGQVCDVVSSCHVVPEDPKKGGTVETGAHGQDNCPGMQVAGQSQHVCL